MTPLFQAAFRNSLAFQLVDLSVGMCVSNAYHIRMNESTGRKMGPRERKERAYSCAHETCGSADDCPNVKIARLADAIDMALDIIETERGGGIYPDLEGSLARLQAALAEVDDG